MGAMNGVELARTLRAGNKDAQIIFVTGYMEYIADGYEVDALHYLVKPVDQKKLFDTLDRAAARRMQNEQALLLEINGESIRIPFNEIKYLEVQRNYVTVYSNERHTVKATLNEFNDKLDDIFYKTGRSHIINLRFIKRVTKADIYLTEGSIIPLPRGQYKAINKAMIDFL
jgi:DNA-binding LytR/AlgR family response regulator